MASTRVEDGAGDDPGSNRPDPARAVSETCRPDSLGREIRIGDNSARDAVANLDSVNLTAGAQARTAATATQARPADATTRDKEVIVDVTSQDKTRSTRENRCDTCCCRRCPMQRPRATDKRCSVKEITRLPAPSFTSMVTLTAIDLFAAISTIS